MAMWLIGKKLKKRHRLKDDVRQSLYDEANYWLRGIKARGTTFMGGSKPDLSDLAVYGILKSIEGCDAFQDLLTHTKIGIWYNAVKEQVDAHSGSVSLSR
jgi:microsomal prostaglandin-E synthase 2